MPAQAQKQKTKQAQWSAEPTAVFGVRLGAPLDSGNIPNCMGTTIPEGPDRLPFCSSRPDGMSGVTMIEALPIRSFDRGFIERHENVVVALHLEGSRANYAEARAVLIERFGPPTRVSMVDVQNSMGATFKSQQSAWIGNRVSLTLDERSGQVDTFNATFTHMQAARKDASERADKRAGEAAKF